MLRPLFKHEEHFWSSKTRKDVTELDKVPGGAAIMIKDFLMHEEMQSSSDLFSTEKLCFRDGG